MQGGIWEELEVRLGSGRRKAGSGVRVRTEQGLVVEQNGWQINPVKFYEEAKKMG